MFATSSCSTSDRDSMIAEAGMQVQRNASIAQTGVLLMHPGVAEPAACVRIPPSGQTSSGDASQEDAHFFEVSTSPPD